MQLSVFFLWSHSLKFFKWYFSKCIFQIWYLKYLYKDWTLQIFLLTPIWQRTFLLTLSLISHLSSEKWTLNESSVDFTVLHLHIEIEERRPAERNDLETIIILEIIWKNAPQIWSNVKVAAIMFFFHLWCFVKMVKILSRWK